MKYYTRDGITQLVANTVRNFVSQRYLIDEDCYFSTPSSFRVRLAKIYCNSIYETLISTIEKGDFIMLSVVVLRDNREIYHSLHLFRKYGDSDMYVLIQDKNSIFDKEDINDGTNLE